MADGEITEPRDEESTDQQVPRRRNSEPPVEFRLEMRDALPGDRAIIGVEQEGVLVWVASKKHVPPNVASDIDEQMRRVVRDWKQKWPGA